MAELNEDFQEMVLILFVPVSASFKKNTSYFCAFIPSILLTCRTQQVRVFYDGMLATRL